MSFITLDKRRDGLAGFPSGYEPLGHDDCGDPLAVDEDGKVWSFQHGGGDWQTRSLAFETVGQLEDYVAFQSSFVIHEDESLDDLRDRKRRIEQFGRQQRRAPFTVRSVAEVLAELREELADRRFKSSKRGRSLESRQALGQRCEQALREAGAPGEWMIRAHVDQERALVVLGRFVEPWTEPKVRALLSPLLAVGNELICREWPSPPR